MTTCCPHGDEKIHRHDTAARPDRGGGYPTDTGYISTYTTGTRTVGTRIGELRTVSTHATGATRAYRPGVGRSHAHRCRPAHDQFRRSGFDRFRRLRRRTTRTDTTHRSTSITDTTRQGTDVVRKCTADLAIGVARRWEIAGGASRAGRYRHGCRPVAEAPWRGGLRRLVRQHRDHRRRAVMSPPAPAQRGSERMGADR